MRRLICFFIGIGLFGCDQSNQQIENQESIPLFSKIPSSQSGIHFKNIVEEKYDNMFEIFLYVYNGGGVATGDINDDGLLDLYFTSNEQKDKLYLNQGDLKFEDITETALPQTISGWDNGVSMVDINGDQLMDIYVCRGGWQDTPAERRNLLFVNQGNLTFKEQAAEYGLDDTGFSMQASFFDFDQDTDLDMYLINRPDTFHLSVPVMSQRATNPPDDSRDKLYVNQGGKFVEQGKERGLGQNYGYGLNVITSDINNDGHLDIYVTNDFLVRDYLWVNQGDGTFMDESLTAFNHLALYSMGSDVSDINNDGLEDIAVMEMRSSDYIRSKISMPSMETEQFYETIENGQHKQYMHNMLFLNQGSTKFSEISQYSGVAKTDWSWSVLSSDLDLDGQKDLFVTNGMKRDIFDQDAVLRMQDIARKNPQQFSSRSKIQTEGYKLILDAFRQIKIKNYLFQNNSDLGFKDVSKEWGFNDISLSNGSALADLDNDGDLDIVINNMDDEAFLYENKSADQGGNFIGIDLSGTKGNTNEVGAKIELYHDGNYQYLQHKPVRGYLSSSDTRVHFGLGESTKIDSLKVTWVDGTMSVFKNLIGNQYVSIDKSQAKEIIDDNTKENNMVANAIDIFSSNPFEHKENEFNEYAEQILLPHMFSKNGPFMSVADINGDGIEDFFIGGAAGQAGQVYIQKNGKMTPLTSPIFLQDKEFEDMNSAFVDVDGDEDLDLIVVSGGSKFPEGHDLYRDRIYYNNGKGNFTKRSFLPSQSSGSCIAPYDIDQDGDVDLFIGGQVIANNYLHAPESYLYINEGGNFVDRTDEIMPDLRRAGMIYSATWTDMDGDELAELVVVGEWMPIQIYKNVNGTWQESSENFGLNNTEGWWQFVKADDLDKDGDMDLILGNQGENYKFKASEKKPFEVYVGDFDENGTNDIFLAKYNKSKLVPIRGRECTSDQMPVILDKFPTYASFAYADLPQIIGSEIESAINKKAYLMSSIILENVDGILKVKKLPKEAQFSTLLGAEVHDFNGDGIKDLIIAGNKFDVEVETTAADASPGYILIGKGNLEFEAVRPSDSGLMIPYNVKDLKSISIGNNEHFLISKNNAPIGAIVVR